MFRASAESLDALVLEKAKYSCSAGYDDCTAKETTTRRLPVMRLSPEPGSA
jgi:hypothetical protein